jgi:hypothetical protein
MGDLTVRQPHLGRETVALLHRAVESQAAGLAQGNIESYLLVRLLRCGYIRRNKSGVFVATPAGVERSRLALLLARRSQEEHERREIIRSRVQAMIDRLERDASATHQTPSLRDLPGYRESALPPPQSPLIRKRSSPASSQPEPQAGHHTPRPTPEDALRLIGEVGQRAKRERELLIWGADRLGAAYDGDLPVVRVGRLPPRREATPSVTNNDDLQPMRVAHVADAQLGWPSRDDAATQPKAPDERTSQWGRAAVVGIAAVILLAAEPLYRDLLPMALLPRQAPVVPAMIQARAPASAQAQTALLVQDAAARRSNAAPNASRPMRFAAAAPAPATPGHHADDTPSASGATPVARTHQSQPEAQAAATRPAPPTSSAATGPSVAATVHDVAKPAVAASPAPLVIAAEPPVGIEPAVIAMAPPGSSPAAAEPSTSAPPPITASNPQTVQSPPSANRTASPAATGDSALVAKASTDPPPLAEPASHAVPPTAPDRVPTRPRWYKKLDSTIVDRLNALSLLAARQGNVFRPSSAGGLKSPSQAARRGRAPYQSAKASSAVFAP